MNELEKLKNTPLDTKILNLSPQNHKRRTYVRSFLTKELINELVTERNYSAHYIASSIFKPLGYNTGAHMIIGMCKEFGIKTKSIKEQANNPFVRNSYKETCIDKYGGENALSKNTISYKKRNRTVKNKYGVANVFQLDSVKNKSKETLFKKYGVYSPRQLPWYKANSGRRSRIHKLVEKYLEEVGINFSSEEKNKFTKYNDHLQRIYAPQVDILIEDKKIVLEINGDVWHGNPKLYKPTDVIKKWGGDVTCKEIWDFDSARKEQIESFGYKVIVLWQLDIMRNFDTIKKIINENCKN
jgi:G:T-mismatch repair DNA endonuclease (very short patch repair protein)